MACYVIYDSERNPIGHICGDLGPHCKECGDCGDEFLCDYPVGKGKTCDAPLCGYHAREVAPNVHYCSGHYQKWQEFVATGGVTMVLQNVVPFAATPIDKSEG